MGIKYFFKWFKQSFSENIKIIKTTENFDIDIDNFLIDMNGIFHFCAQKTFRYGTFKKYKDISYSYKKQNNYFLEQVGIYINNLISFVKPKKRVVLCIDGVAPLSKQIQQRQRRYRNQSNDSFDSNSITPGTLFMDNLSNYLEWFIRLQLSNNPNWENIEIVFSNEKVPGEGEHKLIKYVRNFCNEKESFMIHGMDADLIMLALASNRENFHILRENPYKNNSEFFYINIKEVRETLVLSLLNKPSNIPDQFFINDFILMMFISGNDFLPNLPTIDILEGSIESFFSTYRNIIELYGNIVSQCNTINIKPLSVLLKNLGLLEISFLEDKSQKIIDPLLFKYCKISENDSKLDWVNYRKEYYLNKFGCSSEKDIENICKLYLNGMQWILTYYLDGISCWKWFYPYQYAPFCSDLANFCENIDFKNTDKIVSNNLPFEPFFQLLCVLPPKSSSLLPNPINDIIKELSEFYPENVKIDMDGKRNDWEGIVILPELNFKKIYKYYKTAILKVDKRELLRNKNSTTFIFSNGNHAYEYVSFYGNIKKCKTIVQLIKL
jgi:5'-3' exoribonuclease 1